MTKMNPEQFDLVVIGGGPGGYVAAIRASQLGMKTALVERAHLGGICLNWGCIPTKTLLRSAEIYHLMHRADEFGLKASNIGINLEKIIDRSRHVAKQLSTGIQHLLKKNKVTVFEAHGKLAGVGLIDLEDSKTKAKSQLKAKNIILATGARARILPGFEPDEDKVWTYKEAMTPKRLPKSMIIIGSGAIGIEFASFYNDLGVNVQVIEALDRVVPSEDHEISDIAGKLFQKNGIKIHVSSKVTKIVKSTKDVEIFIEHAGKESSIKAEVVVLAIGIVANTEHLGLETTKVKVEKNNIVTNQFLQTDEPSIYAIGDLVGTPWLAHKASHEGILAVEHMLKMPNAHAIDPMNIPKCTYARPQIASIGLNEKQALEKYKKIKVGRFPFMANGKAIAMGETDGLIKTIFDENTGALLGVHMIGAEVTELIQGFVIAIGLETTEEELMRTIFPHPTLSEMMHESVLSAYGRAIHI